MGRLVGFAAQCFPYTCKVWRSSLVRCSGGTGLAHPPSVTQDSGSEPSAAQSSCRKTDNVQVLPLSTPGWTHLAPTCYRTHLSEFPVLEG